MIVSITGDRRPGLPVVSRMATVMRVMATVMRVKPPRHAAMPISAYMPEWDVVVS